MLRRTFTLLEFARIVLSPDLPRTSADTPAEALRGLVATAARHRSLGTVEDDDDVQSVTANVEFSDEVMAQL